MWKIQLSTAQWVFFIVWTQVISASLHLWRIGDHFEGSYLFGATTTFSILGVIAIRNGVRLAQKEGTVE